MRSSGSSSAVTSSAEHRPSSLTGSLDAARLVLCGGRGLGSREGFFAMVELAELLGGQAAGTRGALDAKWIAHDREIGLSGVRTAPEVYVGFGVSGANFHTIGMEHAGTIIAVDPDRSARIHQLAHCSVYADATGCIRGLTERVRALGRGAPGFDPVALVKGYFQELSQQQTL